MTPVVRVCGVTPYLIYKSALSDVIIEELTLLVLSPIIIAVETFLNESTKVS